MTRASGPGTLYSIAIAQNRFLDISCTIFPTLMSHLFIFTPTITFHVTKSWFSYFHSESPTIYSPHYSQSKRVKLLLRNPFRDFSFASRIQSPIPPSLLASLASVCRQPSLRSPARCCSKAPGGSLPRSTHKALLHFLNHPLASEHSQSSTSFSEPPLPLLGKSSCSFHVFLIFSSFIEISLTYNLVLVQGISTTLIFLYIAT